MRRAIVLAFAFVTVLAARRADACGVWSMHDVKGYDIGWGIESGAVVTGKARTTVATFYLDLEMHQRVAHGHTVVFDTVGGAVMRYGKPIGRVTARGVTFGDHAYTISLASPHRYHDLPAWTLVVERDGETVVTSDDAAAFCGAGRSERDGEGLDEIRQRVIYYLAWRETGM